MYGHLSHNIFVKVSATLLFVFLTVYIFHPLVTHEHHEGPTPGYLSFVHVVITERAELFSPVLILLGALFVARNLGIIHTTRRRIQHVDIPIFLPLSSALAQGIIHSKAF